MTTLKGELANKLAVLKMENRDIDVSPTPALRREFENMESSVTLSPAQIDRAVAIAKEILSRGERL